MARKRFKYYHLSEKPNLEVLTPKVPECALSEFEDTTIPRVCFSNSIAGCLSALGQCPTRYYVYVPKYDTKMFRPKKLVRDSQYTGEVWSKEEIPVKCIGIIDSYDWLYFDEYECELYEDKYGDMNTTIAVFHYPYKWIEKRY